MKRLAFLLAFSFFQSAFASDIEWRFYAADAASSKFSPANLINRKNVGKMKVAWQWESPDNGNPKAPSAAYNESTPIMVDGVLYTSTSLNQVEALDPATGNVIWNYDPKAYLGQTPPNAQWVHRGVTYWNSGSKKRIIYGTNEAYLLSLDAKTGKLDENFGDHGSVDLIQELGRPVERRKYAVTSPVMICKDTVIVGSSITDFPQSFGAAPGDVRGFDVQTGKLKWTFHTIPQAGEKGVETWENESWRRIGQANVWAVMSADFDLGAVYLPVSTPSNDYYGGERPGDGLFGESLVSVDCATGKLNWHYQLVHHGVWDYDPPAPPILMDLDVKQDDGSTKKVKAIAQVTKQAFTYVFDRVTGEPVWPINETPVEQSTVPGEKLSLTQPIPSKPAAFDRQGLSIDDLIDFTPALRSEAETILEKYHYGKLFTPPVLGKPTVFMPGVIGGASWAGAAYNPITHKLYVPSVTQPYGLSIAAKPGDYAYKSTLLGSGFVKGPQGLPITKPPYGRVTAIDMDLGDHAWMVPSGTGPKEKLAALGVNLPKGDLGWDRRTHVLLTPEILFTAQSGTFVWSIDSVTSPNSIPTTIADDDPALKALDAETGETLAKFTLPHNGWGAPMTYVYKGKQYVVVPYGGANLDGGMIAFTLE